MSKSPEPIPLEEHPVLKDFGAFRHYYTGVFTRVARETLGFFGWNKRTLLVPVLYVVGAIVGFIMLEGEVVRDEIMTALAFGLIPVAGPRGHTSPVLPQRKLELTRVSSGKSQ